MVGGVNGDIGLPAMDIRGLELDNVTTHHPAMEVHHVLGLHLKKLHVIQVILIQYANIVLSYNTSLVFLYFGSIF